MPVVEQEVFDGLPCERCGFDEAVSVLVVASGEVVAELVGCRHCRTGVCADGRRSL